MPITNPISTGSLCQEEFAAIDYRVMRCAYDCQNELGRLCDEVIYQNDLAARLEAADLGPVRTEVPVIVTHRNFSKAYFLDLVIGNSAIYELKVVSQLMAEHEAQLLNYLFLAGIGHGKLINFRPAQVESRFVNTTLTAETRRQVTLDTCRWDEDGDESRNLRLAFLALLDDWGGFLELPLYLEALTHLLGGENQVMKMVPLTRDGVALGRQSFSMLAPDIAFRITALTEGYAEDQERHLCSLLRHTPLRIMQWINMARHKVQLVTLTK